MSGRGQFGGGLRRALTVTSTRAARPLEECLCGWTLTCRCNWPTHIRIIPPGPGEDPEFSEFAVTCTRCNTPHWMHVDLEGARQ